MEAIEEMAIHTVEEETGSPISLIPWAKEELAIVRRELIARARAGLEPSLTL